MNVITFYLLIIVLIVMVESSLISASKQQTAKCPPLKLRNGYYKGRTDRRRFMRFDCYPGYYLAGQRYLYCKKGQWDGHPPRCVKPTCSAVRNITNGGYFANPTYRGSVIMFFCNPEYKLLGDDTTYCDGTIWENPVPTCIKNGESPATECDFEKDLCGWAHDLNHDFDWRRQNKSTPSGHAETGPQFDHTLGTGQEGNYMYIESTSRLENDTARLFSPLYKPDPNFGCFEFFYHMYGKTIGTLNVYVRSESQNFYLHPIRPKFSKSGNQGNKWYRGNIVLGEFKEPFQIIIEGIRGSGFVSDIAIDDVKLRPSCIEDEMTTVLYEKTTSPVPYTDSFEVKQTCDGRCFVQTNDSSCTCYEDCILDNSCCPDFIEICILSPTSNDGNTTEVEVIKTSPTIIIKVPSSTIKTTLMSSTNDSYTTTNERPTPTSTTKTTTSTIKPTTSTTKTTTTTIKPTTSTITKTTTSTRKPTTPLAIPSTKRPTPSTKIPTPTTKKPTPTTKKPTPTTKSIINPTTILPTKTSITTKSTISTTLFKKTTLKPTDANIKFHPRTTEEPLLPSTHSVMASSKIQEKNNYIFLITGIALTILFTVALLVISLNKIRNHRKLHSRNQSESTTDVRYISSNEIIDFTLASPDDESHRLL